MKKRIITMAILAVLICGFVFGFPFGSSNLGFSGYPPFSGREPTKPFRSDEYSARTYKDEVENYIEEANNYIEAAANDIEAIREAISTTEDEVNRVIDEYNNWVRYGR